MMDFKLTEKQQHFQEQVRDFMTTKVRPQLAQYARELETGERWIPLTTIEDLKPKVKVAGLWNLFMPPHSGQPQIDESFVFEGTQLNNLEYVLCAEEMS